MMMVLAKNISQIERYSSSFFLFSAAFRLDDYLFSFLFLFFTLIYLDLSIYPARVRRECKYLVWFAVLFVTAELITISAPTLSTLVTFECFDFLGDSFDTYLSYVDSGDR